MDNCIIALLIPHVPPEENEAKCFEIDITHGVMRLNMILVSFYALALSSNLFKYIYIYIKKNWRATGLELTTSAPSRTIVTDGNC